MASEVDICNLALAHIGDEAAVSSISPPDGSAQADHCKRFYPMARDAFLEMHNWNFATRRTALALLSLDTLPADWAYAYAYPTCIRPLAVYPPELVTTTNERLIFNSDEFLRRARAYPFTIESLSDDSRVIYSNVEDAEIAYVARVADTAKFSPLFTMALARLLASYLAGPVIKGKAGLEIAKAQFEVFEKLEGPRAKAFNAQAAQDTSYDDFIPGGIAARQ